MTALAATNEDRATEFAAAVRAHLADLPVDELDDLLDGLQSDLTERLADGDELGDPLTYAEELRQAAGLPERELEPQKQRRTLTELADVAGSGFRRWVEGSAFRRSVRAFLVSLRPVWWILRGLLLPFALMVGLTIVTGATWWFFPDRAYASFPFVLLTIASVILSVQWGRGRWAPQRWIVWARRFASVITAIALIPALGIVLDRIAGPDYVGEPTPFQSGLSYEGTEIGNIFAYDCNGQLLDGVQLFTRDGQPLVTTLGGPGGEAPWLYDELTGTDAPYAKNSLAIGPNGWNVFPLQTAPLNLEGNPGAPVPAPAPFAQVPAISNECPAVTQDQASESGATPGASSESKADPKPDTKRDDAATQDPQP